MKTLTKLNITRVTAAIESGCFGGGYVSKPIFLLKPNVEIDIYKYLIRI